MFQTWHNKCTKEQQPIQPDLAIYSSVESWWITNTLTYIHSCLGKNFFSEWPNVWSCCLILSKSSNSTEQVIFYHTEFRVLCSVILIEIVYMCVMGDKLKSTQKVFFCFHHLFKLCLTLIVKTVPTFIMGEIFFCIIISYII